MPIAENIAQLRTTLPEGVTLVAVSKTHPPKAIMDAYSAGQRIFGENRPQEMATKQAVLPADIRWHQIGHLQTNKVRLIAPFVSLVHSVDSARLAREISRQAVVFGRVIDVLLEICIAREATKEGWTWDELVEWIENGEWREFSGLRLRGVMGVATFTDDEAVVRGEFETLARMHALLREKFFDADFNIISMGMSDDYPIALECGSTMVRIGSAIFGARQYCEKIPKTDR